MFLAQNWKDYEVIDTSGGEKLERWGKYILVRPDPQVIWNTPRKDPKWRKINARYHRSSSGGGDWEFIDLPKQWTIGYSLGGKELTFHLKPFSFKHTGLFPEQAVNWEWFSEKIRTAVNAGRKMQPPPDSETLRSAGLWTTARSLSSVRSAEAITMTRSSWIRLLMAEARKGSCGRWRIISMNWSP